jgi:shikimate dehydrogenase
MYWEVLVQISRWLRIDELANETMGLLHFGLIGYPLEHSYSPLLHQTALAKTNLAGDYKLFPVMPGPGANQNLRDYVDLLTSGKLQGLNVTIPHKQTIIEILDETTSLSNAIGAVNAVYLDQGQVIGHNFDAPAFESELLSTGVGDRKNALVLGAGGACRAVCYALLARGWQVQIAARRKTQIQAIQNQMSANFGQNSVQPLDLSYESLEPNIKSVELIVNTTPLGMAPHLDISPWPTGLAFPKSAVLFDLIYNPAWTKLMEQASMSGLQCLNGSGMLVEQAALSFELWTGVKAPRAAMHAALERELTPKHEN